MCCVNSWQRSCVNCRCTVTLTLVSVHNQLLAVDSIAFTQEFVMANVADMPNWTEYEMFTAHVMLNEGHCALTVSEKLQKPVDEVISYAALNIFANLPDISSHGRSHFTPRTQKSTQKSTLKISDVSNNILNKKIMECLIKDVDPFEDIKIHSGHQIIHQMRRIEKDEMVGDVEDVMLTIATLL